MPNEQTVDRLHMLERAAALLADYALGTGLDASEFRGMCEEAYENAYESRIDADAENRAGTFTPRVLDAGDDLRLRNSFAPIPDFRLGVLPVPISDADGGFSLHLIEGGKRG